MSTLERWGLDPKQKAKPGCVYVVATPIGNLEDLSLRCLSMLDSCDIVACEDTRVTGKLLKKLNIKKPMVSYRDHNEKERSSELIDKVKAGASLALVSDAGTPCISDPGFRLVRACRVAKVPVMAVPGPSAVVSALSIAGIPTDRFYFVGFLAPKKSARVRFFEEHKSFGHTIVLYESCHRIEKALNDMLEVLGPDRVIGLAREITKMHETFFVDTIASVQELCKTASHKGEFVLMIAPEGFEL